MRDDEKLDGLIKLCEDLQYKVNSNDINCSEEFSLRFSCDLLLRNMIALLEIEKGNKNFSQHLGYLENNILGTHAHLTNEDLKTTKKKYKIKI
ncbi:hypothetical protein [Bacillus sp. AFS040349]|uniref:hypothetical protein n=1 Tax=Bacillus sp. AFS040349 TaxID=2033502 RepID=UPI000BFE7D98|nr:hypothetical protein [Bacillus sp. AFS040349]PGT89232.1 hypothetical protein COD11_04330 [Bacillus sp. AFS040349]